MEWIVVVLIIWLFGLDEGDSSNESGTISEDNIPKKKIGFLSEFNSGLNRYNKFLDDASKLMSTKAIVLKETQELYRVICSEKKLIEIPLKLARIRLEVEARCKESEDFRQIYDSLFNDNETCFENKKINIREYMDFKSPDFTVSIGDFDGEVIEAINARILELKKERDNFFKNLQRELRNNSALKQGFLNSLSEYIKEVIRPDSQEEASRYFKQLLTSF